MKDLIKETIEKIKDQGIAPEPRWKYLVKKYGMWAVFGVIILLGAITFFPTSRLSCVRTGVIGITSGHVMMIFVYFDSLRPMFSAIAGLHSFR